MDAMGNTHILKLDRWGGLSTVDCCLKISAFPQKHPGLEAFKKVVVLLFHHFDKIMTPSAEVTPSKGKPSISGKTRWVKYFNFRQFHHSEPGSP